QAEDGIRDRTVTGVQTCALPILSWTFLTVVAANLALFGICIALTNRYRHVQMPAIVRKWYDIPVRAFMVACLVAAVVGLSGHVRPEERRVGNERAAWCGAPVTVT